jgi:hypothetical protein
MREKFVSKVPVRRMLQRGDRATVDILVYKGGYHLDLVRQVVWTGCKLSSLDTPDQSYKC